MLFVTNSGRIVRVPRLGKPQNMINRYCHVDPAKAKVGQSEGCYAFVYGEGK